MKINWINFAANIFYLLFAIFVVYVLSVLFGQDPDELVGWCALGMAASAGMEKVIERE